VARDRHTDERDHRHPERVQEVYDGIASHFSKTRAYPWPQIEEFLDGAGGDVGLDVGCGNGRHTELLAKRCDIALGVDVSRNLLSEAVSRMAEDGWRGHLAQGDAAELPVRTGSVDLAVYIATIHHLRDRETRIQSLDELARSLDSDGRALVSAWSTAHDRFDEPAGADEGFDTTVDWTLPDGETVPRFYHIYSSAEFERDIQASDLELANSFLASGNCFAEVHV